MKGKEGVMNEEKRNEHVREGGKRMGREVIGRGRASRATERHETVI